MARKKTIPHTPAQQLLQTAKEAVTRCRSWIELHNAIYGVGGPFARLFPEVSDRTAFANSEEHKAITALIESLPDPDGLSEDREPALSAGKFLLRMPVSLHAALTKEAELEGVSLNQLCVAKLAAQLAAITRPVAS